MQVEEDAIDAAVNGVYIGVMRGRPQTVVETPAYLTAAQGVLSEAERVDVVTMVGENPEAGVPLGGRAQKNEDRPPGNEPCWSLPRSK